MEGFPQPEEIRSTEDKYILGANKSGRQWKVGANRIPNKNWKNKGAKLTWQEKKKLAEQKKQLSQQGKAFKKAL